MGEEPTNRELKLEITAFKETFQVAKEDLRESQHEIKRDVGEIKATLSRLGPLIVKHETRLDFIAGTDGKGGELKRLNDDHNALANRLWAVALGAGTALLAAVGAMFGIKGGGN